MRKFLALPALAVAAFLGLSAAPAQAAVFPNSLGTITVPGGSAFAGIVGEGAFTDLLTFQVNKPAEGFANATSIILNATTGVTNLAYQLFQGATALTSVITAGNDLVYSGLVPSTLYTLHITGTGLQQGGSYSGNVDTTNVVPIPGAVFLFAPALAGLAGLKRFRRKDADAVPAAA